MDNYPRELGPSDSLAKDGFIFAYQDVRGRNLSEGAFIEIPAHKPRLAGPADTDESTDTYDTIDWLVKNVAGNNGKVGMWGISYDGFFAAFSLIHAHPALKAVSPQAPMADVADGDDAYHNGAFYLAANFGFYTFFEPRTGDPARPGAEQEFDYGTADEYDFYLRMGPLDNGHGYLQHANPYWDAETGAHPLRRILADRAASAQYMQEHHARDHCSWAAGSMPRIWRVRRSCSARRSKTAPKAPDTLVMGPWPHGGWARGRWRPTRQPAFRLARPPPISGSRSISVLLAKSERQGRWLERHGWPAGQSDCVRDRHGPGHDRHERPGERSGVGQHERGSNYAVTATAVGAASPANFSLTNTASTINDTITVTSGTGQSTTVNTAFGSPLVATVTDQFGNVVAGMSVTFTAPGSGPSGSFTNLSGTISGTTNSAGQLSEAFGANTIAGSNYIVTATAAGAGNIANFSLTNTAATTNDTITVTSGSGQSRRSTPRSRMRWWRR